MSAIIRILGYAWLVMTITATVAEYIFIWALDGATALNYVRSRTLEVADPNGDIVDDDGQRWRLLDQRSDLDRIARQQSFIRKLAGTAISKALSDPFLAVSLADSVIGYLKADQNLSRDDVNGC